MCLFIKPGCKIEIAEGPIVVFKKIRDVDSGKWQGILFYDIFDKDIEIKVTEHLVKQEIHIGKDLTYPGIEEGVHSFVLEETAGIKKNYEREHSLSLAIIPRGAEYCLGLMDEIVSNQIIVFSSKEKLDEYLKTH